VLDVHYHLNFLVVDLQEEYYQKLLLHLVLHLHHQILQFFLHHLQLLHHLHHQLM
jgi:hypothetical protein